MQSLFKNIYKDKTVFVTGHTGFKGSWLSLWLQALGAKVVGYALSPPTQPSLYQVLRLDRETQDITGDIRDYDSLLSAMRSHRPDFVFHTAAQSLVRLSYREPRDTFSTNLMGTVNVLEAVRNTPSIRVCVNVTSDKCYDNKEWVYAYRENDPMGGYDPYSSSKGCAELAASAFARSFFNPDKYDQHGVRLASVRAGNVIGGGDWAEDRIIPDCVRSLVGNDIIQVRNPNAIRPWQHVLDPLSGYLWLGALLWENAITHDYGWNFGPDLQDCVTVEKIVTKFVELWGSGSWVKGSDENGMQQPHEANFLKLDCAKVASLLKWRPVYTFDQSLRTTFNWYNLFYTNTQFDARAFTLSQIMAYVEEARQRNILWAM